MRQSILLAALAVSACQPADSPGEPGGPQADGTVAAGPTGIASSTGASFSAIAPDETIRLVGTEPFWGGTVAGGEMIYSTLEDQDGQTIAVRRFAGNNGLGFSGTYNGAPLDLTVTPGTCSDGMSDRVFPFTVTLKLGAEQRNGCAWTDRAPFTGAQNP